MFAMRMEHGAAYDCVMKTTASRRPAILRSPGLRAGLECEKENVLSSAAVTKETRLKRRRTK